MRRYQLFTSLRHLRKEGKRVLAMRSAYAPYSELVSAWINIYKYVATYMNATILFQR